METRQIRNQWYIFGLSLFLNAWFIWLSYMPIKDHTINSPANLVDQVRRPVAYNELRRSTLFMTKPLKTPRDQYEGMRRDAHLSHLIIPLHSKQVPRLLQRFADWKLVPPCKAEGISRKPTCTLTIYLDGFPNSNLERKLLSNLDQRVRLCFNNVTFAYANLAKSEQSYLVGSRQMFKAMLGNRIGLVDPWYVFYMEPDCVPIRSGWIDALARSVQHPNPTFWVRGSIFHGDAAKMNMRLFYNMLHINGNAFYNLKDAHFKQWYFNELEPFVQRMLPKNGAYDVETFQYLLMESLTKHIGQKRRIGNLSLLMVNKDDKALMGRQEARSLAHFFQYTGIIRNYWKSAYNVTEQLVAHPHVYLIHGGTKIDEALQNN